MVDAELNYTMEQLNTAISRVFNNLLASGAIQATLLDVDNIRIDGNTISTTDTDGPILLKPNNDGKVAIGDTSVNGIEFDPTASGGDVSSIEFWESGSKKAYLDYRGASAVGVPDTLRILNNDNGLNIDASGNVFLTFAKNLQWKEGVLVRAHMTGTTTGALQLYGENLLGVEIQSGGNVFLPNLGSAGAGTDLVITGSNEVIPKSSSEKVKNSIADIERTVSEILKLEPKQFFYNTRESEGLCCSFIAEDVYKVYPEAVNLDKDGNPLSLRIDGIIAAMFKVILNQEKRISELESK